MNDGDNQRFAKFLETYGIMLVLVAIMAFLTAEIVRNFNIPAAIARQATTLALGYDSAAAAAEAPALEDIWGAMIVGAMQELEKRYGNPQEPNHD